MAPLASEHFVALAGMVALMAGALLFLARIFALGFLADSLSQTVLVGFLPGVAFQVGIAMLGDMLGMQLTPTARSNNYSRSFVAGVPQISPPSVWRLR